MLFLHFIGLAMALGGGFSNQFLGFAIAKMEPAERAAFMSKAMVLMKMGQIGLGLLLLSGLYLMSPFWSVLGDLPYLMVKLGLVVLLVLNVIFVTVMMAKARKAKDAEAIARLRPLGMVNFGLGILIALMAVMTFH